MKSTIIVKVYGEDGRHQKESFNRSERYNFSEKISKGKIDTRIIEVLNYDKTGTHDYTIVKITRNTLQECYSELDGQISDGIFEECRVGNVEIVDEIAPKIQFELTI